MNIPGYRLPMPPPVPPCCGRAPNPLLPGTLQWPLPLLKEWFNSRADSLVDMTIERLGGLSGLYRLPDGGIPLLDLSDEVRTILGNKADRATTLAGYGIADAYTKAETGTAISAAISAVVNSAPAAFDTLKEIADWIGDAGSGVQAVINQVADKVDKVAGKGLSTNDYTTAEKDKLSGVEAGARDNVVEAASVSAFSQTGAAGKIYVAKDENKAYRWNGSQYVQMGGGSSVEVVPPSTNPADAGKAADAKATGDALAGKLSKAEAEAGFTEWKLSGVPNGATEIAGPEFVIDDPQYVLYFTYNEVDYEGWTIVSGEDVTSIVFDCTDVDDTAPHITVTATRTRLPTMADIPTKTSDLTNDSGFLTQHQQLVPVYSQWTCNPPALDGETLSVAELADMYELRAGDYPISVVVKTGGETSLTFSERGVTAIRTVIGYTLGDQTTKPLQPQGDYAPATNIPKTALASDVQTSLGRADTAVQPAALAGYATTAQLAQKADVSVLRYDLGTSQTITSEDVQTDATDPNNPVTYAEITLLDRTLNVVDVRVDVDELRPVFPTDVTGKILDFGLYVGVSDGVTAPAFVRPNGVGFYNSDGKIPDIQPGGEDSYAYTLMYFSEVEPGAYLVKGEQMKEA